MAPTRIFFDTEFHEDGQKIELISIGLVVEGGPSFYRINLDYDWDRATGWLQVNVLPHLPSPSKRPELWKTKKEIRDDLLRFVEEVSPGRGEKPEFWAYFASYDWVVLCQLFGRMIDLPEVFPMFCHDLKSVANILKIPKVAFPPQKSGNHDALADAGWNLELYRFLRQVAPGFLR